MTKTQRGEIVITNPGSDKVKGLHTVKKEETNFYKSNGPNCKTVIVWNLYYEELYWLDVSKLSNKDDFAFIPKRKRPCESPQFFAGR